MSEGKKESTALWRVSDWERMRQQTGTSGFATLGQPTVLPTTLMADLAKLGARRRDASVMEVVAACMRHRESAMVVLRHRGLVWPVTLFPVVGLYHAPLSIADSLPQGPQDVHVLSVEPAGLRPPGHVQWERVAALEDYRALPPLLWMLALHAPRPELLSDIGGRAAYRIAADFTLGTLAVGGALGPALQRLRHEISSIEDIAGWPGMSTERAVRLLNAIYLQGGLMVLRTHHAARDGAAEPAGWLDRMRRKR
jgi:hypothetical protein